MRHHWTPRLLPTSRASAVASRGAGTVAHWTHILAAWSRSVPPEEAAERLQRAGVAATLVYDARDVLSDPPLRARGFIQVDEHPRTGSRPMPMAPWRFRRMGPLVYRHAAGLGANDKYVFRELLGLSTADIRDFEAERVIY